MDSTDIERHEKWLESLESRVVMLLTEHTLPTGDRGTYFGHSISAPITAEREEVFEALKPHIDWTPKDLYGLRKEVERFEFTLKALKATITEHIQASISKRKSFKYD